MPRPQPNAWTTHTIRLQFIATTNTIAFDPQLLVPVVTAMNAFFDAGKITFVYDPVRDFVVEDNTLLDQDWELVDVGSLNNPEALPPTEDVHALSRGAPACGGASTSASWSSTSASAPFWSGRAPVAGPW